MKRLRSLLPLLVLFALGVGLFFSGALDRFRPDELPHQQEVLEGYVRDYPVLSRFVHVVVMTLGISTGIPGCVVLIFAGGMLFGVFWGTLLSSIGVTLGALILFFASRAAFGDPENGAAPALVERLRAGYLAHPVSYSFFLRLVPVFPFGGITIALAWLGCPIWLFTLATAMGGSVMTAIETALGAGIAQTFHETGKVDAGMLTHPNVLVPVVGLALFALVPIAVNRWRSVRAARRASGG